MNNKYTTTTNDPVILELVTQYKAARAELATAQETVLISPAGSDGWSAAVDDLMEKAKCLNELEVSLCISFVSALERSR